MTAATALVMALTAIATGTRPGPRNAVPVALGGEIKRIRRSQLWGIIGSLVFCTLIIAGFDLLTGHAFGDRFQGAIASTPYMQGVFSY